MNGGYDTRPHRVRVNQRALVQKVLARYPEEFTVFRELVQNADDAEARSVQIEFQTQEYSEATSEEDLMNGFALDSVDFNEMKIFKWIVVNNGRKFDGEDWDRLTSIADGNPNDQKIGAFGVGFYSVFSVTECPVVISGDRQVKLFYEGDELMVQCESCAFTPGAAIEMKTKKEQMCMPKPFDLSRFLSTAMTFLTTIEKVTVRFNGYVISEIQRSRGVPNQIEALPAELKKRSGSNVLTVTSVKTIPQTIQVTLKKQACAAGTSRMYINEASSEKDGISRTERVAAFFGFKSAESNSHAPLSRSILASDTTSVAKYTIYSAEVSSTPTEEMNSGLEAAIKKDPPRSFSCEVVYFDMAQHQQIMQDGDGDGLGSVFRGPQALCGEKTDDHVSRLFIGQSTAQTSGIAAHVSSRFIPTVERGSIDLANGFVAKWNEELLYICGYLTRLIYEQVMKNIQDQWTESSGERKDYLRAEALYVMKCFAFQPSTPESKVGEILKDAFFQCSTSDSFPILSNLGIRPSKDVRQPDATFKQFMKDRPVLDDKGKDSIVNNLPKRYCVRDYNFQDVYTELEGRVLVDEEMVALLRWWMRKFTAKDSGVSVKKLREAWALLPPVCRFQSKSLSRTLTLSTIKKFVDTRQPSFSLRGDDPLPPDTIPILFTSTLDANQVITALGWERLTLVDWIRYLVSPGLDARNDICKDESFSERVLDMLHGLWPPAKLDDRDSIISLMRTVPCIATNRGWRKPQEAYFPEVDLFDELPVVKFLPQDYPRSDQTVLDALGVHRYLPWDHVRDRLLSDAKCSTTHLVTYLDAVRPYMSQEEFMSVKQMPIFTSEPEKERRCIGELYRSDPLHHSIGLPMLYSSELVRPSDTLYDLGLRRYPPLEVIISKACNDDPLVKEAAWKFFVKHLDDYYDQYDPENFRDAPFLPCTSRGKSLFSSPGKVFTSSDWEVFGFYTISKSAVPLKLRMKLKVKDKPPTDAIIDAVRSHPQPDVHKAKKWFELLATEGFSAHQLAVLSEMDIVPLPPGPLKGEKQETTPRFISPKKCFYESPEGRQKLYHYVIFPYVKFGPPANSFLKRCEAKPHPDCSDIVSAMMDNPQGYLDKIEAFLEETQQADLQSHKLYLDDLRQVAAGYDTLPRNLRDRMKLAPIFLAFRRKLRTTKGQLKSDSKEYALKPANEILILDDSESHRLFGEYIYVAPKEEVFENFYRDHGSESLSLRIKHEVMQSGFIAETDDLRCHVFSRLRIFLEDQDSTRLSDFRVGRWRDARAFTVKYCRALQIRKTLEFEHVTVPDSKPLCPIEEPALAGIEHTEQGDILWVKKQPDGEAIDWYDAAVALCRIIFSVHKTHDTVLLMTILESKIDDLRRRGYDVDRIWDAFEEETLRADQRQDVAHQIVNQVIIPIRAPFFLWRMFKDSRKNKGSFEYADMESMVAEALTMCESDADIKRSLNTERNKPKGGKKKMDVGYCGSRQIELERYKIVTKKGMPVFKSRGSEDPPENELETFSTILYELAKLFDLGPERIHIFWHPAVTEMMGFNRNRAIYLNLAHFTEKHAHCPSSNDNSRATMYTAWYFIIAHEIAHNKYFFHDEDHELLFSSIAQHRLIAFKKLLDKRAPSAT